MQFSSKTLIEIFFKLIELFLLIDICSEIGKAIFYCRDLENCANGSF
jgi:hypothetical protein